MSNRSKVLARNEALYQSQVFGSQYEKRIEAAESSFYYKDIDERYQSIRMNTALTSFQEIVLHKIFSEFEKIRKLIDPNLLELFDYDLNADSEFLLFRTSKTGLTNIIIHDDESLAYSFIPFDQNSTSTLIFYTLEADFEALALKFFAF